jgi:predicted anti-sigma-YlaC factor YlaD
MNEHLHDNCERFEAMIAACFDGDDVSTGERAELNAHVASCVSCRESFELSSRMEAALVSRRAEVPAVDAFLPSFVPARAREAARLHAHPHLIRVFRAVMSPAGIAIILVTWAAMLGLRFRELIGKVFVWTSSDRFSALGHDITNLLLSVSRGDPYTLGIIYVALAVAVLGSTGAITLRYIRHS